MHENGAAVPFPRCRIDVSLLGLTGRLRREDRDVCAKDIEYLASIFGMSDDGCHEISPPFSF